MEASSVACLDGAEEDSRSFSQRAEELFDTLAEDDAVYVNPRGLLTVMTSLKLYVSEEQFAGAAGRVLAPQEKYFSKEAFVRFVETLRKEQSGEPVGELLPCDSVPKVEDTSPTSVLSDLSTTAPPSSASSVAPDSFSFTPKIAVDALPEAERASAMVVYAKVQPEMVDDICAAVDAKLQNLLSTLPSMSTDCLDELRANWLREHYVSVVSDVVDTWLRAKWTFVPALALDELCAEQRSRAAELYEAVDPAAEEKINAMVDSEFQQYHAGLSLTMSSDLVVHVRKAWLEENYVKIVSHVVSAAELPPSSSFTFQPRISLKLIPEDKRAAAQFLYSQVTASSAREIEAAVDSELARTLDQIPAAAGPSVRDEVRSLWLQQNYCSVIERFVSMPSSRVAPDHSWSFTPAIPVESLPLEEQSRARDVYASVTREVVADIAGVTDDSWNTFFSSLKVTLPADATANLRKTWLSQEYVNIVRNVVAGSVRPPRKRPTPSPSCVSPSRMECSVQGSSSSCTSFDVTTPKRKIRRRDSDVPSVAKRKRSDLKVWCAADMHAPESWVDDRWNVFCGTVLSADDAPRNQNGAKKVFNAVLADNTGAITLVAWGSQADELAALITQLDNSADQGNDLVLRVELFSISQMKTSLRALCPIAVIQTSPAVRVKGQPATRDLVHDDADIDAARGTQFSLVSASTVRTPSSMNLPSLQCSISGISDYDAFSTMRPPFRANVAGVVGEVADAQFSTGGTGKLVRSFVLVDPRGSFITIRQFGSGSDDPEIQRQRTVVVYFATGMAPRTSGQPGSLWAYEDSYIKVVGQARFVPNYVKEVVIPAE